MVLPAAPRAVVTGAAGGLGRALSLALARRRGRLVLADVDVASAEETAHLVVRGGGEARVTRCDVSRAEDVDALRSVASATFGGADLLVNNAGIAVCGPLEAIPLHDWERVVAVNLMGVVHGCRVFLPHFKARGAGHILNVASAGALLTNPEMSPYFAAKAGVIALSESLAAELHGTGVGVTILCPTFFQSGLARATRSYGEQRERIPALVERLMKRSTLQADGVAAAALEAVDQGRLYALPHADGRWMWRLKRAAPELVQGSLLPGAIALVRRIWFT